MNTLMTTPSRFLEAPAEHAAVLAIGSDAPR